MYGRAGHRWQVSPGGPPGKAPAEKNDYVWTIVLPGYVSRLHGFSLWDTGYNPVGHLEVSSHRLAHTIAFSFCFPPKDSYFMVLVKRDGRVGDNETTVKV